MKRVIVKNRETCHLKIILLPFSVLYVLGLFRSVVCGHRGVCCVMVCCYSTTLPSSSSRDVTVVAGNLWEYLHGRNWQTLQIGLIYCFVEDPEELSAKGCKGLANKDLGLCGQ